MDERTPRQNFSQAELETMRREVLAWIERDHRRRAAPVVAAAEKPPGPPKRPVAKRRARAQNSQTAVPPPAVPASAIESPVRRTGEIPRWPLVLPLGRTDPPKGQQRRQRRKTKHLTHRRRTRWWAAGAGLGLAVFATLVFLLGVYRWGWHGRVTAAIARFTPLPAATAGTNVLWLGDFLADVETLRRQARRTGRPVKEAQLRQLALARFAAEVALEGLALRYQVMVSNNEIQSQRERLAHKFGSEAGFQSAVRENFPGWDRQRFVDKLLRPYLLEQALRARLREDPGAWEAAAVRLKAVMQTLAARTQSFANAAQLTNRDGSAAVGGDLGYRGQAELDPSVFAAALALADGAISAPLRTAQGYLLIQRDSAVGEGADLRLRLRQIVVSPEIFFEALMSQALVQLAPRRFVP